MRFGFCWLALPLPPQQRTEVGMHGRGDVLPVYRCSRSAHRFAPLRPSSLGSPGLRSALQALFRWFVRACSVVAAGEQVHLHRSSVLFTRRGSASLPAIWQPHEAFFWTSSCSCVMLPLAAFFSQHQKSSRHILCSHDRASGQATADGGRAIDTLNCKTQFHLPSPWLPAAAQLAPQGRSCTSMRC